MKNKIPYIFLLSICIGCQISSNQPLSRIIESSKRLETAIQNKGSDTSALTADLNKAFSLSDKYADRQHDSVLAVACKLKGLALADKDKYAEARFYYEKGLRYGRRHLSTTTDIIMRCYRNMAISYYQTDDYQNALRYYDSVQIIQNDAVSLTMKIETLSQSATCYQGLKDFESSERFAQTACELAEPFFEKPKLAALYMRYVTILRAAHKYQSSIKYAQKAIDIFSSLSKATKLTKSDSSTWANSFFYLAYAFKDSGLYQAAIPYYIKAIDVNHKLGNINNQTSGLLNLSNAYRLVKQYDKAEQNLAAAIAIIQKQPTISNTLVVRKGELYTGLNEVFMDKKEYNKAFMAQDSAIVHLTRYGESVSLTNLLLNHRYNLLAIYTDKAKAYTALAENGTDTEGHTKALKLTQQIIDLTDDIRADYFSDDAKLTLANDIKPALEKAIGVCQKLYQKTRDTLYLNKAFAFVEYSRSMVLYENARLDNQLPPDLKAENAELKKREAALIAKNNVEELQNYLRLKRQFREKIKSLNHNQLASVATLQTALLKNKSTALIEFFVGDSSIFVFTMLQNDLKFLAIPKPKNFEQQIETLRQGITQPRPVRESTAFVQQSGQLYALLLRGVCEQLPTNISQFIIAPDGVLSYLPFELLIKTDTTLTDFRKVDYLLKHYSISYAYSANLLLEQKRTKKDKPSQLFAGFASKYENKDTLNATADVSRAVLTRDNAYELKGAKEEVAAISQIVGGKAFADADATEGVFKREANQYRILHFAMHSLTNDKEPMLSKLLFTLTPKDTLNDNDLTAAELYTMPLNADLAVLSACNTGFGTISKGEGVMSLARAFTYAGVPATVTSLWKVPDLTTREIMVAFYKNLKSGMTKDAALREAKLTYLKNAPESIAANPFFWAGFVPMGNMDAMDMTEKAPLSIFWILCGLLVVSGLVFWWKKK